ncbi:hypothetical protein MO867_15115 [Microbulbifer sp. OS29]|uniref:Uncharacterized protein n=1 Tax=Microbulbifer okhotskensis TaxID=2926617 RepID=A0A9X2EPX1_9GAMM|nr:hypothetical protein [Microbulbifer okhotskensis]MCO1335666.1 hypothetical protein [Microbulbifer okhotskensis]
MINKYAVGLFLLCFSLGDICVAHQFANKLDLKTIGDIKLDDLVELGISVQSKKLTDSGWGNHREIILQSSSLVFNKKTTKLIVALVTKDDLLAVMNNFELSDKYPFEITIPNNLKLVILVEIEESKGGLRPGRYRFEFK